MKKLHWNITKKKISERFFERNEKWILFSNFTNFQGDFSRDFERNGEKNLSKQFSGRKKSFSWTYSPPPSCYSPAELNFASIFTSVEQCKNIRIVTTSFASRPFSLFFSTCIRFFTPSFNILVCATCTLHSLYSSFDIFADENANKHLLVNNILYNEHLYKYRYKINCRTLGTTNVRM